MSQSSSGGSRAVATVVFLVAVAAAIIVPITRPGQSLYPKQWDPRVVPIVDKVAQLRGLAFEHPVRVRFLPDKEFEKEVAGDPADSSDSNTAEAQRGERDVRARSGSSVAASISQSP